MSPEEFKTTNKKDRIVPSGQRGKATLTSSSIEGELPWWVELLFVQIGLPDNWLRGFLKSRKLVRQYIVRNKTPIRYTFIAIFLLVYLNPIHKQARNYNTCIDGAEEYVKENLTIDNSKDSKIVMAYSNRFCNGGDIN